MPMIENPPSPIESAEDVDWYRFGNGRGAVVQSRTRLDGSEEWIMTTGVWYGDAFLPRQISPALLLHTPLHTRRGYLATLLLGIIEAL